MPRTTPSLAPAQRDQLRAETEAVRERIWQRWAAWQLVFAAEQRVREVRS